MDNDKTYTREQLDFINEYCTTYGLFPDQIVFFGDDPKPLFDREATSVLLHRLTDCIGIEDDVVPSVFDDTITIKYRVTFKDGSFASSTGVANFGELKNGEAMSAEEIKSLATSRAARSALTNKGIDLIRLHERRKSADDAIDSVSQRSAFKLERDLLLGSVHILGKEKGLITYWSNREWRRSLNDLFDVESSRDLSDVQLKGFQAYLKTLPDAKTLAA